VREHVRGSLHLVGDDGHDVLLRVVPVLTDAPSVSSARDAPKLSLTA